MRLYKTALFVITLLRICPHLKARAAEKCSLWLGIHMPSKNLRGSNTETEKGNWGPKKFSATLTLSEMSSLRH